jgi:hypothetical protein
MFPHLGIWQESILSFSLSFFLSFHRAFLFCPLSCPSFSSLQPKAHEELLFPSWSSSFSYP